MAGLRAVALVTAAAALALAACSTGGGRAASSVSTTTKPTPTASSTPAPSSPAATPAAVVPRLRHVVLVVMENLGYDAAVPAFATLAARGARADDYYAVAHPSLPNYLALDTGSTWGITSDCTDCYVSGPDLAQQLSAAGISWGAFMEGLPSPCWLGSSTGNYAGKHDPFRYVRQVRGSPSLCGRIRPLTELYADLSGPPGSLPSFAWVTPDLCHDGHDCDPAQAARWLEGFVGRVTSSPSWDKDAAVFVTWDEAEGGDDRGGGGHVLTFALSPSIPAGRRVSTPASHYSLLRTVEEALGLPLLGHAGDPGRSDLAAVWG
ncbi:MAG TPA: alkaline phosphatase family protein [Acidimicrobiales bacterium]|nr:alkaline phosphatase family protein [Acidimicrobiales bacterium]